MTQAELDKAVIEAAEHFESDFTNKVQAFGTDQTFDKLREAVRARRAAMRPHKAALVARLWFGDDQGRYEWSALEESTKKKMRAQLAEILAAPDEEQP